MAKTKLEEAGLPQQIRVSVGSAIALGLLDGRMDVAPTTAYLMTYKTGKCTANCGFCPQARNSLSETGLLSRVTWPPFSTKSVLSGIEKAVNSRTIRRVCIQALNYPEVFSHVTALVKAIKQRTAVPVSVSCQPLSSSNIQRLAEAGADRIGIAIDAATEKLFNEIKGSSAGGPYNWENQFKLLQEALKFFGKGNVSTHLIVGLGETEKEAVNFLQKSVEIGVLPALFAFTPIRGTALEGKSQPAIEAYRRIQLARNLIAEEASRYEHMRFDADGRITDFGVEKERVTRLVETGKPFLTSGCADCNRPFYNEKPSGPFYNYPRRMNPEEIATAKKQLDL